MRKKAIVTVPVVELDVELSENWQQPDIDIAFSYRTREDEAKEAAEE